MSESSKGGAGEVARGGVTRAWFLSTGSLRSPAAVLGLARGPANERSAGARSGPLSAVLARLGVDVVRLPIAVMVIEHAPRSASEPGEVTLVDVGWSAAQCRAPRATLGWATSAFLGVEARAGDDVAAQLARRGVERARVKTIVATHLHVDHVGGVDDFPDAEVVTSDEELRSARERGRLHGFDVDALARVGRFRIARWDERSRLEFPASARLADGVLLLDARGHTAGSCAVAVELGERTLVHLGDAAYTLGEALRGEQSPLARRTSWDLERQRTTYRAIARLSRAGGATLVTSHDPTTWAAVEGEVFTAAGR